MTWDKMFKKANRYNRGCRIAIAIVNFTEEKKK